MLCDGLIRQVGFPSAVVIPASVPADRCEQADDPIEHATPDPVHATVAARTSDSTASPLRPPGHNTIARRGQVEISLSLTAGVNFSKSSLGCGWNQRHELSHR
jgi:hypothetical protein